jgi:outer membrane receptor for ferric coprogen and ferric-rhodotorulic acid
VGQVQREITNIPSFLEQYNGIEFTLKKRMADRWQMMMGYTYSSATSNYVEVPWNFYDANDPNNTIFVNGRVTGYDTPNILKLSGTYLLPWDIGVSGNYRFYTGKPLTPSLTVSLNQGYVSVPTELRGQTRYPSVSLLDLRVSRVFKVGPKAKLEAMLNLFNALNAATIISEVTTVGAAFGTPQQIMTPRILGFGARLTF